MKELSFTKVLGTIVLVLIIMAIFGLVLPMLFSTKSDASVIIGFGVAALISAGVITMSYNYLVKKKNN